MKYILESSTKEEYNNFKKTLGKTDKSECFNDFLSALHND